MTLTIALAPEEQARLEAAARARAMSVDECVRRLITEHLPPAAPEDATVALLTRWLEEDATDDPEEIRKAQEELDGFKRAMNAERERAGARRLYP